MKIETMAATTTVDVSSGDEGVELRIDGPREAGSAVARLALPQAEMVLHALGLALAQIREQQRRAAEERQRVARVVAETEVRRR
jgi:hypothetical protein